MRGITKQSHSQKEMGTGGLVGTALWTKVSAKHSLF